MVSRVVFVAFALLLLVRPAAIAQPAPVVADPVHAPAAVGPVLAPGVAHAPVAAQEAQPVQPAHPAPPAQPAQPAQAVQPAGPAHAVQPAQPAQPAQAPVIPAAAPRAQVPPDPGPPRKNVNIRVDATVIESRGDQVGSKKTISATVMDGENGSVRSTIIVPVPALIDPARKDNQRGVLNMDVRARLRDDGKVHVQLTLEAQGGRIELGGGDTANDAGIRQSVSVLLDPGKPLVVSQSADAVGDRRLALEVKATVLK